MNKSLKNLLFYLALFSFGGCATFPHTAALMIGDAGDKVLSDTIHVLGNPKSGGKSSTIVTAEDAQAEVRIFNYSAAYDLALYFYNGAFIQAILFKPEEKSFPQIRNDYQDIQNRSQGPDGYLLKKKGDKISLEIITKKRPK